MAIDVFRDEYEQFRWDVHILIEGTLRAAIRYLDTEAKDEMGKLEDWMKKPISDEAHEHLVDEHVGVMAQNYDQERFLRNMALVALTSRLNHSLKQMARSAETFSPRKGKCGHRSISEFNRLWLEYKDRFGIDFESNKERIAFVEPLQVVRNQIVHDGGEANTLKPIAEMDLSDGQLDFLDRRFSEKYPEYVSGDEVSVTAELLEKNLTHSVDLVGWLAGELRKKELASIRQNP